MTWVGCGGLQWKRVSNSTQWCWLLYSHTQNLVFWLQFLKIKPPKTFFNCSTFFNLILFKLKVWNDFRFWLLYVYIRYIYVINFVPLVINWCLLAKIILEILFLIKQNIYRWDLLYTKIPRGVYRYLCRGRGEGLTLIHILLGVGFPLEAKVVV